jgi:hypothetical protein
MKKIYKISLLLTGFLLLWVSCKKDDFVQINPNIIISVQLSETNIILTENTAQDRVLTVSWEQPDYGFDAAPSYIVMVDLEGNDFSTAQTFPVGTDMKKEFMGQELNNALLSLGASSGTASGVIFKVRSKLSDYKAIDSDIINAQITPYGSTLDLSTEWGVVGSATPGGWGTPDILIYPFIKPEHQIFWSLTFI